MPTAETAPAAAEDTPKAEDKPAAEEPAAAAAAATAEGAPAAAESSETPAKESPKETKVIDQIKRNSLVGRFFGNKKKESLAAAAEPAPAEQAAAAEPAAATTEESAATPEAPAAAEQPAAKGNNELSGLYGSECAREEEKRYRDKSGVQSDTRGRTCEQLYLINH